MTPAPPRLGPHRYRVTVPMRAPRYFRARWFAHDYARYTPGAVTHRRDVHPNGATGPWIELTGAPTT